MKLTCLDPIVFAAIVSLVLAGCALAAQRDGPDAGAATVSPVRQSLPASSWGAHLLVSVDARSLPGLRVNLQVHLLARRVFRDVTVRVTLAAPDPTLAVPSGCMFQLLRPAPAMVHKPHATPLPVIPLCSLVLAARKAGTYPLDLRVLDGKGRSLAPPIFVWVRFLSRGIPRP
jgi:hypothetical protein